MRYRMFLVLTAAVAATCLGCTGMGNGEGNGNGVKTYSQLGRQGTQLERADSNGRVGRIKAH